MLKAWNLCGNNVFFSPSRPAKAFQPFEQPCTKEASRSTAVLSSSRMLIHSDTFIIEQISIAGHIKIVSPYPFLWGSMSNQGNHSEEPCTLSQRWMVNIHRLYKNTRASEILQYSLLQKFTPKSHSNQVSKP